MLFITHCSINRRGLERRSENSELRGGEPAPLTTGLRARNKHVVRGPALSSELNS